MRSIPTKVGIPASHTEIPTCLFGRQAFVGMVASISLSFCPFARRACGIVKGKPRHELLLRITHLI